MKMRSRRCLLILLAALTCCSGTCFERDTRVSVIDSRNPPTFKLSGNGLLQSFVIYGPFTSVEQMERPGSSDPYVLWKLYAKDFRRVYDLSQFTYGIVPEWASQAVPEQGPPKSLEEGKIYAASSQAAEANFRVFCFTIKTGQVTKVDCRER